MLNLEKQSRCNAYHRIIVSIGNITKLGATPITHGRSTRTNWPDSRCVNDLAAVTNKRYGYFVMLGQKIHMSVNRIKGLACTHVEVIYQILSCGVET